MEVTGKITRVFIPDSFVEIKGTDGMYAVSRLGEIWSNWTHKKLAPILTKRGYLTVTIKFSDGLKIKRVHRLVAEAFIPNPENKPDINHINGIKTDNRDVNLEWCTCSENQYHAFKLGLREPSPNMKGKFNENNPLSKPIIQRDLSGNFIKEWPSIAEAVRSGFENISLAVKTGRKRNGYLWEFK